MDTTTMGVKLDRETRDRLQKLGKARNRSSHWLMREAIRRYLRSRNATNRRRLRIRHGIKPILRQATTSAMKTC